MSTLWNPVTPDPGDTLKGCTLVGAKRLVEAEKPVVAAGQIAAKRQRTLLLPPAATALLGETATAYHKLVEFDRRLDLTVKHHRSTIEARLRAAGVGPNGETISAFPVAPFPPLARVLRLYVEFTQDAAVDPIQHAQQPGAMPWTLRLWGVNAHNEEAGAVDLSRHFLKIHISFVGSNPPVVVDWQPQGRPTLVLSVTRLTQPSAELMADIRLWVRQLSGPSQGVMLLRPLANFLSHPEESPLPFRQVVEQVWTVVKEHRLQEPERRNYPRGSTIALQSFPALMRLLGLPEGTNAEFLQMSDLMKYLRQQVRGAEQVPVQIVHRFGPSTDAYEVLYYEPDPLTLDLAHGLAATARPPQQLAPLDAQLRATLEQLRTRTLKRSWLRSLLYEPPASGAGAAGGAAGSSSGGAAAEGPRLRSLEDFASALVETQVHVSRHALTPAALRPQGEGLGEAAVRDAVAALLKQGS